MGLFIMLNFWCEIIAAIIAKHHHHHTITTGYSSDSTPTEKRLRITAIEGYHTTIQRKPSESLYGSAAKCRRAAHGSSQEP
ncbi:hypothetical protein RB195_019744 [Necator americanus]|uniref:Secreted protein n=1 Tax=Necator americanus TaxID=51031 RepID=A0ABR1CH71_NECAM